MKDEAKTASWTKDVSAKEIRRDYQKGLISKKEAIARLVNVISKNRNNKQSYIEPLMLKMSL